MCAVKQRSLYKEERYAITIMNEIKKQMRHPPTEGCPRISNEVELTKYPLYSAFLLAFVLNFISAYTNP